MAECSGKRFTLYQVGDVTVRALHKSQMEGQNEDLKCASSDQSETGAEVVILKRVAVCKCITAKRVDKGSKTQHGKVERSFCFH